MPWLTGTVTRLVSPVFPGVFLIIKLTFPALITANVSSIRLKDVFSSGFHRSFCRVLTGNQLAGIANKHGIFNRVLDSS
jgi:hypothetical protein